MERCRILALVSSPLLHTPYLHFAASPGYAEIGTALPLRKWQSRPTRPATLYRHSPQQPGTPHCCIGDSRATAHLCKPCRSLGCTASPSGLVPTCRRHRLLNKPNTPSTRRTCNPYLRRNRHRTCPSSPAHRRREPLRTVGTASLLVSGCGRRSMNNQTMVTNPQTRNPPGRSLDHSRPAQPLQSPLRGRDRTAVGPSESQLTPWACSHQNRARSSCGFAAPDRCHNRQ
mmetsp:Transcript_38170/g.85518  ORF Transcript_38170/g.85518 Transcript_38170/m.85518 type:complete len:229 (-) Transcript_38170:730-1416(-)